jgi:GNAT superfamily N-acetyltransferase
METQPAKQLLTLIREAQKDDIPRVIDMGRDFLLSGPYATQLEDCPGAAAETAYKTLQNNNAKILLAEYEGKIIGVFAFIIFPHYFSGELTAGELIWYVEPGFRGQASMELLWAAEKMASDLGAKRMQLTAPTERVGELYRRLKYVQVEVSYQAKLCNRVKTCQ